MASKRRSQLIFPDLRQIVFGKASISFGSFSRSRTVDLKKNFGAQPLFSCISIRLCYDGAMPRAESVAGKNNRGCLKAAPDERVFSW